MKKNTTLALMLAFAFSLTHSPYAHPENAARYPRVLAPFELVGIRARYHVIAWFTGHPDWESVEAFAHDDGKIRAILTRHGGLQVDAFNYGSPDVSAGRDWYSSAITLTVAKNGKDAKLEMMTPEGKPLVLSFVGEEKPSARYGGLTDPGNHSPDTGLPAMYRRASAVSGPESSITIDGKSYGIPMDEKISRPPFFTAYSAFLSEGFESLFIRAYGEKPVPALVLEGDERGNAAEQGMIRARAMYTTGVSTNLVTLARSGEDVGIASIESSTKNLSPDSDSPGYGGTELRFDPPLANPESLQDNEKATSRFSIIFDGGRAMAIEGTVTVTRSDRRVSMILQPEKPEWLRATRAIRYEIDLSGGEPLASATVIAVKREPAQ